MIRNGHYNPEWYIHSGCTPHMTDRKHHLKDYQALKGVGNVKFGNEEIAEIKDYEKITNGDFTIKYSFYERSQT